MIEGLWGKKIGMTQVYSQDKVVPVTAINISDWFVTGFKTQDRDGYDAVQVGCVRDRYKDMSFSKEWLKKTKKHFSLLREVSFTGSFDTLKVGQKVDSLSSVKEGDVIDVVGKSKGRGFAGVMKRHGFSGGPASHGGKIGRRPGAIGFMASCGRVIKGKKLPGRMGNESKTIKRLPVVKVDLENKIVLVKGSVPGCAGSFVFIRKQDA